MKFSYASLPDHPVDEIVDTIVLADELGFYGAYMADETYHKDGWLIVARSPPERPSGSASRRA